MSAPPAGPAAIAAALRPGERRSWWLREALAAEGDPAPLPPLRGSTDADVAIVGGGYTGLWSAWSLLGRVPADRIVILEQDICGGGPSGRNGGFVHGWWEDVGHLAGRYGPEAALEIARAADEVVDGIGAWCEAHGVDAWYRRAGYLRVNGFPHEDPDWGATLHRLRALGLDGAMRPLRADAVRSICASPAFGEGVFMPSAASIQPALLARGLRRVLVERGVRIHEGTTVRAVQPGRRVEVTAAGGRVTAGDAILAINAWAAGWPGLGSRVFSWASYMVLTQPIPDRLAALGWTGGELISDSRFTISYFRTTRDGRIAFGAGVGAAGYGGRIGRTFTHDRHAVARVVANFHHLFPMLRDVALEDAWGGPIDITGHRFPEVASILGGRVHVAHGFAGNGAGPSRLAGRILAALVARDGDPIAELAFVGRRQPLMPPEPFRSIGARIVREALIRQDDALDAGRRPWWGLRWIAQLPRVLGYRIGH